MISKLGKKNFDVRFYVDSGVFFKDAKEWKPDVVALANYSWNSNLAGHAFRYACTTNPNTICVAGGPEFPVDLRECEEYLMRRREIDFYVYREGEVAFTEFIRKVLKNRGKTCLKKEVYDGIMFVRGAKNPRLVVGKPLPRIENLDEIPSPYLSGMMDQWFDGHFIPSIETVRGCAFTCGYCKASQKWFSPLSKFSLERIQKETTYIAKKMVHFPNVAFSICDSNFGMTKDDERVAVHLAGLQKRHGWPSDFSSSTGKRNFGQIFKVVSILNNKMAVTASPQSTNPKTLEIIKRKNLPIEKHMEICQEAQRRGIFFSAELILPMPMETKASFFDAVRRFANAGVNYFVPYTTMLLRGTPLASQEFRKQYGMKTRFRLIPRQFGEYFDRKSFEIEEVCVATNTLSFEEYLECRGFGLISALFSLEQFDVVYRHLKELEIDVYEFLISFFDQIKSERTYISQIYIEYIQETQEELFGSPEDLEEYFSKTENYQKLLSGELGDNLIRKYKTKMVLEGGIDLIKLVYEILMRVGGNKMTKEVVSSLRSAEKWMVAGRNMKEAVFNESFRKSSRVVEVFHDVNSWYHDRDESRNLLSYGGAHGYRYRVKYNAEVIESILTDARKLYGDDIIFIIGKFVDEFSVRGFKLLWGEFDPA